MVFSSAMAPELSPCDTTVSPATLEGVSDGVAKPMRRQIAGDGLGEEKAHRLGRFGSVPPRPNSLVEADARGASLGGVVGGR